MKFIALAIGIIGILPLSLLLRSNPNLREKVWILLGIMPFMLVVTPFVSVAIVTWDQIWFSYVPGFQITVIDLIAVALFFSVKSKRVSIHYQIPFILYLAAISLSVLQAEKPPAAIFYVWQFVRMYFFAIVVAKGCTEQNTAIQLMRGLAIGLSIQTVTVFWQKFGLHIVEPSGTFVHRNTLGLIIHMVIFPHFSLYLAGQRQMQYFLTPLMGLAIAALIASRAALAFSVFGFAATYLLSLARKPSSWKAVIGVAGIAVIAIVAPIAHTSLERRFDASPLMDDEYDERAAFNRTALSMLSANPFGVGVNHYSYIGKNHGYSVSNGVAPIEGSLNNTVHNAYLLAGAEAGYFGMISFIILALYPLLIASKYALISNRRDWRGDLLLGLAVAMMTAYIHSFFEYIIVIKEVQYVLMIVFGMTFGLAHQIKIERLTNGPKKV
jgi:hypothetical protein